MEIKIEIENEASRFSDEYKWVAIHVDGDRMLVEEIVEAIKKFVDEKKLRIY